MDICPTPLSSSAHKPINFAISTWMQVSHSVFRCVYVRKIYSSIAKDLKFDWEMQITWKGRSIGKSDLFEQMIRLSIFTGKATWKLANTPAFIFSYLCRGRSFIFKKQIIIVLLSHYSGLQIFFKISVLKSRKHLCRSLLLISQ